jgi:ribosome-associated protein
MEEIKITTEFIKLGQLLKLTHIISSGSEEKIYAATREILVNGQLENRRGRKLYPGDVIEAEKRVFVIR